MHACMRAWLKRFTKLVRATFVENHPSDAAPAFAEDGCMDSFKHETAGFLQPQKTHPTWTASKHASKHASRQASEQASRQASMEANHLDPTRARSLMTVTNFS